MRISPSNPSPFSTLEKPRMRNGSLEVMFLAQVVCFFSWDVFPCAGGLVSASSFRKKCRHITCIIVVPKVGWFYLVCKTPIYAQSRGVLLPFTVVQRWGQGVTHKASTPYTVTGKQLIQFRFTHLVSKVLSPNFYW